MGQTPVKNYTEYWCASCETPVCPHDCYDQHRKTKYGNDYDSDWKIFYLFIYLKYYYISKETLNKF